ncbi:MAG TPA: acyl-CoA synthetase [Rhizomicrobium sp.]|jgi:fatty-acyl-CoA synthase|nr:acyl-CoA synthetase [Rhizomicrobium sp.]
MPWNYGDLLEAVSNAVGPTAPAFAHGERVVAWGEAKKRMNNLARAMRARGAKTGDKVAFYLRNSIEYSEALGACFLARLTHVNVNYRYKPDEVRYILDNSDAQTVIYGSEFRDAVAQIHNQLPKVKTFIEVSDGDVAPFAQNYEKLATTGDGVPLGIERSRDDELFIYTGGTTGMPKGVIYAHGDLMDLWFTRMERTLGVRAPSIDAFCAMVKMAPVQSRTIPACPQMHGTGLITTLTTMMSGGCVITVEGTHFDPHGTWQAAVRHGATAMSIVGDPFAKPLLHALDEEPGRYDLSKMTGMTSSGAMWSADVKEGLIRHIPQIVLTDSFASTEAMGMGSSTASKDAHTRTAGFAIGEDAIVIDEDDRPIEPGSGRAGRVALGGFLPVGYYKDPEKTARTFRVIDGKRYSIPGDYGLVEADGSITLLGRGSNCINTAGEKVFPEEVEEALKTHPSVEDALVLGVPDDKWGQAVTGVVTLVNGSKFDEERLRAHVRSQLAGYKTPKRILVAGVNLRAPNGKADYRSASEFARRELGIV